MLPKTSSAGSMNFITVIAIISLFFSSGTDAYKLEKTVKYGTPGTLISYGAYYTLRIDLHADFGWELDAKSRGYFFDSSCAYEPAVGTVLLAAANKYGEYSKKFNTTIRNVKSKCFEESGYTWKTKDLYKSYVNATKFSVDLDSSKNYTGVIFYQPVNLTSEQINSRYSYYENSYYNLDEISLFAGMFYLYFVFVFLIHGISNLLIRWGLNTKFNSRLLKIYRSKIAIPALFNEKHTEESATFKIFTTLVPTRLESVVVFFFIFLNFLLTCINYEFDSKMFEKKVLFMRYVANRTGLLSFGLIPLLIIFAGRNNLLISLTGIPYSSFIFYHKWVSRFMFIHALIHSVLWTAYGVHYDYLAAYCEAAYWRWGIVATIIAGLMVFQAFHLLRKVSYEVFYCIHVVLGALFIVGCWYHCIILGYTEWLYAACAVWGADRFVRIFRILLFGIRDGELKYVGDDTIRLSVKQGKFFDPFPGAYAFIYFGTPLKFWQSHPFTIMKSVIEEGHIVCYIKSKSGITKSIRDQLEKSPGMTKTMKIAVEGPYGHRSPIERYESVLLLGGGNGIPGLFSHASELVQRGLASKKRVKLIWSIRNAQSLCWFYDELKQLAGSSVQVDIFITGKSPKMILEEKPSYSSEKNSESEAKSESEKDLVVGESVSADSVVAELSSYVNFHYQRPDVDRLIKEELFAEGDPSVAVVTCGPPKMVDLARHSVATNLVEAKGRVDLFEELQVW